MNHILIPSDFSTEAEEAFIFAISIAQATKAKITTLHVIDIPVLADPVTGTPFYIDSQLYNSLEQTAKRKFEEYRVKHAKNFENITLVVKEGPVTATVNNFIKEHSVDLIVMGTKGATGMKEFFIGSNTEKIVRLSPVPVFAIRKASALKEIKNIVFPTSLALNQSDFIHKLKDLQTLFNAHLHLLYINTPHSFMDDEDMNEFIKFYDLTNVSHSFLNAVIEEDGILSYVHEKNPDLVVMATNGRKGLAHLFSGSISENIVNHITCPICTYVLKKTEEPDMVSQETKAMAKRKQRHLE